jgi:hypothetical protein
MVLCLKARESRSPPGLPIHPRFLPRIPVTAAGWSSPVARQAHNLKAAGSNPAPATNFMHLSRIDKQATSRSSQFLGRVVRSTRATCRKTSSCRPRPGSGSTTSLTPFTWSVRAPCPFSFPSMSALLTALGPIKRNEATGKTPSDEAAYSGARWSYSLRVC